MEPLSFFARFWFAWVAFFRIVFDGAYAAKVLSSGEAAALPPAPTESEPEPIEKPRAPDNASALQLLALLQREGRLVDFLEEDVASFGDADIGAAARVVHSGCRKALREHVKLEPVRNEEEGARVSLPAGFSGEDVKLTGNVSGSGPHTGTLKHRGWKATEITLPTSVGKHDPRVLAQAEVEL